MTAHPQILVANEPLVYRDVLGSQLPRLRPGLAVLRVDPAELDEAVARLRPRLVICNEVTDRIRQFATAALVLDPLGTNRAVLTVDGQDQVLLNPRLADLLAAVDTAVGHGSAATAIPRTG
jgi:DNA-binding IclR family transcriptional regulator